MRVSKSVQRLISVSQPAPRVTQITFDNPKKLNALSVDMGVEFQRAVESIKNEAELPRAIVLAGAGSAFSAGGDLAFLKARKQQNGHSNQAEMRRYYDRFLSIRSLNIPVVSAVHGAAVGAGLCLSLATDLRITAKQAKMAFNFTRLGIHPGMGATHFLPELIGDQLAKYLLLTGKMFSGADAVDYGIALEALDEADQVLPRAIEIASQIVEASPCAVEGTLKTLRMRGGGGLDRALQREADAQAACYHVDDLSEGLAAVMEKRAPKF